MKKRVFHTNVIATTAFSEKAITSVIPVILILFDGFSKKRDIWETFGCYGCHFPLTSSCLVMVVLIFDDATFTSNNNQI